MASKPGKSPVALARKKKPRGKPARESAELAPKLGDCLAEAIAQSMMGNGGLLISPEEGSAFTVTVRDVVPIETGPGGTVLQWLCADPDLYQITVPGTGTAFPTPWGAPGPHPKILALLGQGLIGMTDMVVTWVPVLPLTERGGLVTLLVNPVLMPGATEASFLAAFPGWEYILNQVITPLSATQSQPLYRNMDGAQPFTVVVPCQHDDGAVDTFGNSIAADTRLLPDLYHRLVNKFALTAMFSSMPANTVVGYFETQITLRIQPTPLNVNVAVPGFGSSVLSLLQPPEAMNPALETKLGEAVQGTRDALLYSKDLVHTTQAEAHASVASTARSAIDEVFDWGSDMLHKHGPALMKRLAESAVLAASDGSSPFAAAATGEAAEAGASAIIGIEDYLFGGKYGKYDDREF